MSAPVALGTILVDAAGGRPRWIPPRSQSEARAMIAAFTKATEARTKARDKRNAEAMAAIAAPAPKRTLDPAAIYAERARGGAHGLVAPGETRARR